MNTTLAAMMNADEVRAKHETFPARFRGYEKSEVRAYLGRVALAFEAIDNDATALPELPDDFRPDAVRAHEFTVVWGGLNKKEVRDYLAHLSWNLEAAH